MLVNRLLGSILWYLTRLWSCWFNFIAPLGPAKNLSVLNQLHVYEKNKHLQHVLNYYFQLWMQIIIINWIYRKVWNDDLYVNHSGVIEIYVPKDKPMRGNKSAKKIKLYIAAKRLRFVWMIQFTKENNENGYSGCIQIKRKAK